MHLNGKKLLKCHLKGKASKKLANGQNIDYSEKRKQPKGFICPALGLNTIIFKHVYWYMQQTQVSVYRTIGPLVLGTLPFSPHLLIGLSYMSRNNLERAVKLKKKIKMIMLLLTEFLVIGNL